MTRYNYAKDARVSTAEYRALAVFRYQVRRFLRFSEEAARGAGIEPQQHQMLLAIKGAAAPLTMGELAERLQVQQHSAVELVNRSEKNGLVRRAPSDHDRRKVLLHPTPKGERLLRELSSNHREALQEVGPLLVRSLKELTEAARATKRTAYGPNRTRPRPGD